MISWSLVLHWNKYTVGQHLVMSFFCFLSGYLLHLKVQARAPVRDIQRDWSSLQGEADTCFQCLNTLGEKALTSRYHDLHPKELHPFLPSQHPSLKKNKKCCERSAEKQNCTSPGDKPCWQMSTWLTNGHIVNKYAIQFWIWLSLHHMCGWNESSTEYFLSSWFWRY